MWVCVPQVYLVLLVGVCQFCGSLSGSPLFSENSTIAKVFNVIEDALESVNLLNLIPSLENNTGNPDQYLSTPQLIEKYGYPAEIHTVTTEDKYILTVHRIPYSPKSPAAPNKPVVFLQHGILSSSADWIILGPENSLGYLLADAGFDVWLGNARGNTYSKKHVSLSASDSKFWDFSWHEMGIYDLPAVIDYVLEQTSQPDLYYIGHSMGTSMFFVMTSTLTEYNSKIRLMTALAPIAYMAFVKSPISKFFGANPLTKPLVSMLGINEFLPNGKLTSSILSYVCSDGSIIQQVCSTALFALCGYNPEELNTTLLPVLMSHTPAGSSANSFLHYAQDMNSGSFRQWDYGFITNLFHYGQLSPPEYNLSAITAPVRLLYSDNDWFADPQDVYKLNQSLGNSVGEYRIPLDSFNHLDFVWAIHVKSLVYDEVISFLENY